ncbi:MAG: Ribonuclease P protein component [Candidatus Kapaibacterium sp.]|nr:MAG: Ribonuclease P protein component [Candidatus Kapabacteria bacterium]
MNLKLEPIKRKKDFEILFENGKRFSVGSLRLVVLPKSPDEQNLECVTTVFFAVQVSKKSTKKAVVRNRIKRLLRESLRFLAKNTMKEKIVMFKYIFLGWVEAPRRACEIRLRDVLPVVEKGLNIAFTSIFEKQERGT